MIDVINPLFTRFPELEPCRAAIFSTVDALENASAPEESCCSVETEEAVPTRSTSSAS